MPQGEIAKACKVSREFVNRMAGEVVPTCDRSQVTGQDGRTINTANIGKTRAPSPVVNEPDAEPRALYGHDLDALAFYADEASYPTPGDPVSPILADRGERARRALAGVATKRQHFFQK